MNNNPLVSIIIPLYNKELTISTTIETILKQTYKQFELIIVDDGSTDRSILKVKEFNDPRIKYFQKDNGGVSSARNSGISFANGEFVFLLDADDVIVKDAIERLVQLYKDFPTENVYVCNFNVMQNSEIIRDQVCTSKLRGVVTNPFKSIWSEEVFLRTGNTLIRKACLDKAGLFDERISFFEDLDFVLKLLRRNNVVYDPSIIFTYNMDSNELSSSPIKNENSWSSYAIFKGKSKYERKIIGITTFNIAFRCFKNKDYDYLKQLLIKHKKYLHIIIFAKFSKLIERKVLRF